MKKIAVILSGCGVYDGTEIHESVLTLLAIKKNGVDYQCFAPNIMQHHVINHLTGQEMPETRNVLVESARIARGDVKDIKEYNPVSYDALIIPGGYGAAKNLCDFAFKGADCTVNKDVEKAIIGTVKAGKPVGALCIAPTIIAKVLGDIEVTIGHDESTANAIEKMGATHKKASDTAVVVDKNKKIVTTPCYMLATDITQIAEGAENAIKEVLKLL